jgi:ankyrin repeat protein
MSKTRLIEAVQHLDLKATKELLEKKPSLLTVTNRQGRNLLHLACGASCEKLNLPESAAVRMVGFLLDQGIDIEDPGLSGPDRCTPLWFAVAFSGNLSVVKFLIKRGAKPGLARRRGALCRRLA